MTHGPVVLALTCVLAAAGCTSRPRAPALHAESVYQDESEGFRFEPPRGWNMTVRSAFPAGQPVTQQRKLVEYKFANPVNPASLTVSRLDTTEAIDLLAHFAAKATGPDAWRPVKPVSTVTIDGMPGQTVSLASGVGTKAQIMDITAFQRNGRHYFFMLLCHPDDRSAREAGRRAIATLNWKAG